MGDDDGFLAVVVCQPAAAAGPGRRRRRAPGEVPRLPGQPVRPAGCAARQGRPARRPDVRAARLTGDHDLFSRGPTSHHATMRLEPATGRRGAAPARPPRTADAERCRRTCAVDRRRPGPRSPAPRAGRPTPAPAAGRRQTSTRSWPPRSRRPRPAASSASGTSSRSTPSCASRCCCTGASRQPARTSTFESLMRGLSFRGCSAPRRRTPTSPRRGARRSRSPRPVTSASTTGSGWATRCGRGTAARCVPHPTEDGRREARDRARLRPAAHRRPRRPRGPLARRRVRGRPAARSVAALDVVASLLRWRQAGFAAAWLTSSYAGAAATWT